MKDGYFETFEEYATKMHDAIETGQAGVFLRNNPAALDFNHLADLFEQERYEGLSGDEPLTESLNPDKIILGSAKLMRHHDDDEDDDNDTLAEAIDWIPFELAKAILQNMDEAKALRNPDALPDPEYLDQVYDVFNQSKYLQILGAKGLEKFLNEGASVLFLKPYEKDKIEDMEHDFLNFVSTDSNFLTRNFHIEVISQYANCFLSPVLDAVKIVLKAHPDEYEDQDIPGSVEALRYSSNRLNEYVTADYQRASK